MRHAPRALLALPLLALALAASACGSDDDTATASSGGGGAPEKIVVAYQAIPNGDLVVKNQGWLEEALPDTEIEWKLFDSGGTVIEAFAADSVDIGLAGSSPVSRAISTRVPVQVPWIHDVIGDAEALVVRDDIASFEDLKGKKIATPLASTAHYSLLAAIADAGLAPTDVEIIDAEPDDIYAAWTRGDIDGAYVWNPNLARMEAEGGKVLITSTELAEQGKTTYDLGIVSDDFAEQYPDAVQAWVDQQARAVDLLNSEPDVAAESIAVELSISPEEAGAQIEDLIFVPADEQAGPEYLGGALGEALFATAEFNRAQQQIPSTFDEDVYVDAVKPGFAAKAKTEAPAK
ncbi:MAG TPA: ABC transporter substrate-binding protein [Capillimicrobium sp.]|jgi:taurine transport system substrate-binding protein